VGGEITGVPADTIVRLAREIEPSPHTLPRAGDPNARRMGTNRTFDRHVAHIDR
jgi:hypothetical protein